MMIMEEGRLRQEHIKLPCSVLDELSIPTSTTAILTNLRSFQMRTYLLWTSTLHLHRMDQEQRRAAEGVEGVGRSYSRTLNMRV